MKASRFLSFILVITIMVSFMSVTVYAESPSDVDVMLQIEQKRNFENALDDTVICYYNGYPITKSQIDENHCINIDMSETQSIQPYYVVTPPDVGSGSSDSKKTTTMVIPSQYDEAIVKTQILAPQFSQLTTSMYLTKTNAIAFANDITYGTNESLLGLMAGFIPYIGPVISIAFTIDGLRRSEVASQIREYTDAGKKVQIDIIETNSYGTYYAVKEWPSYTISYTTFTERYSSETLIGISYR